jgi:hypothetical protein
MRSGGGTNFMLALSVAVCTNSMIADFAGPSFQDGSASVPAAAVEAATITANRNTTTRAAFLIVSSSLLLYN